MKRIGILLILMLVLVVPTGVSLAAPFDRIIKDGETVPGDITLFEDDLVVEAGGVVEGDVTIFNGNATIEGTVEGDLAIFDGHLELSGTVEGDVALLGGSVTLNEGATVNGDCALGGGKVTDESDSAACTALGSEIADTFGPFGPFKAGERAIPEMEFSPDIPALPQIPQRPSLAARIGGAALDITELLGRSLLLGLLALVATAIFPNQLAQVEYTIRRKPAASGAVGFLTAIAGPSLLALSSLLVLLTCGLLLPAWIILAVLLVAAAVLGWVALGEIFGRYITRLLRLQNQSTAVTAFLGTTVLSLLLGTLGLLPFIFGESLIFVLLLCVGLGAAALTQFGTRAYPRDMVKAGVEVDRGPSKEEML